MIILDLEWNSGCGEDHLEEILQIGAVKVAKLGGPIVDTFCCYIRPKIHRSFCRNARELPELQQSRRSEVLFPQAVEQFLQWCEGETEFGTWGTGDFTVLRQNAERWKLECAFPQDTLNLQNAFSYTLQAGRQIALYKAVEYCGIPDTFTFHNALNDAVYTALVAGFVSAEGVELARHPPQKPKRTPPTRIKGWSGPFDSWEAALNSRANRHPACPACGGKSGIGQWFYRDPEHCCALFQCTRHGRFLCRLDLRKDGRGQWWGKLSTSPMDRETHREYMAVKKAGSFSCARNGRKRRRFSEKKGAAE